MMTYLGMEFKSYQELRAWTKAGKINEYRSLSKRFNEQSTLELSSMMSDLAQVLIKQFGVTPDELEDIELETL